MAEMLGKQEGCCRGRGGSMHIFDRATRFYGGNAIVGGGLPLAIGVALGDKLQGRKTLTACFFGDGAVEEGEFHESMNLAELWQLPVLFVCENNLYAMGMALERAEAETDIARKARRLPHARRRGRRHGRRRRRGRRARGGRADPRRRRAAIPRMPHLPLPRPFDVRRASSIAARTRSRRGASKGPIARFEGWLRESGLAQRRRVARIEAEADAEIDAAVAFAEAGTLEPVEELERFVTMERVPS